MRVPAALARARDGLPAPLLEVLRRLGAAGHRSWIVGGAVRDLLLHRPREAADFDVATPATPQQVTALFRKVVPTGIEHGTVTVVAGGLAIEVTTFRGEGPYVDGRRPESVTFHTDLEADLERRDFTMNALAWDPIAGEFRDPHGGRADMARRIVRAVGNAAERFAEDGLRPMRAVRFAAQLGLRARPGDAPGHPCGAAGRRAGGGGADLRRARAPRGRPGRGAGGRPHALDGAARRRAAAARRAPAEGAGPRRPGAGRGAPGARAAARRSPPPPRRRRGRVDPGGPSSAPAGVRRGGRPRAGPRLPPRHSGPGPALVRPGGPPLAFRGRGPIAARRCSPSPAPRPRSQPARVARRARLEVKELQARLSQIRRDGPPLSTQDLALDGRGAMAVLGAGPGPHVGEALRHLLDRVLDDPALNDGPALEAELRRWWADRARGD